MGYCVHIAVRALQSELQDNAGELRYLQVFFNHAASRYFRRLAPPEYEYLHIPSMGEELFLPSRAMKWLFCLATNCRLVYVYAITKVGTVGTGKVSQCVWNWTTP